MWSVADRLSARAGWRRRPWPSSAPSGFRRSSAERWTRCWWRRTGHGDRRARRVRECRPAGGHPAGRRAMVLQLTEGTVERPVTSCWQQARDRTALDEAYASFLAWWFSRRGAGQRRGASQARRAGPRNWPESTGPDGFFSNVSKSSHPLTMIRGPWRNCGRLDPADPRTPPRTGELACLHVNGLRLGKWEQPPAANYPGSRTADQASFESASTFGAFNTDTGQRFQAAIRREGCVRGGRPR